MDRFKIHSIETTRLDIPLVRPIMMSIGELRTENIILVRMRDTDGVEGVGEACILGGPYWSSESAESVIATIETYLGPRLIGAEFRGLDALSNLLRSVVRGNPVARSAVESAAVDLIGRKLGHSAVDLLGGAKRTRIPVAWTLSEGSADKDIEAGEQAIEARGHRTFKLKFGHASWCDDLKRAARIVEAFQGRANVTADVNQGWDEQTASQAIAALTDVGLTAIEQPMDGEDLGSIARIRQKAGMDVIADEAISGPDSARRIAEAGAASVLSLKPGRDGGLLASRAVAEVADTAGLALYGGSMLETSLGTAASAHLFASLPHLEFGSELFGPLRLAEDIAINPIEYRDGELVLPMGPGFGIDLDKDKIAFLASSSSTLNRQSA